MWNDIITKINEVANALGKGWNSEYLTYYNTKMHFLYSPLYAKMFNSARYNTNYLTWTWSYDPTATGYIGRTDFQGVAEAGDKNADFVFGAYIVELTKRLNTVIGVINGTGSSIDMRETIGCFVEVASELIMASPQALEAGETFSITHSGTLEQERQRSWFLHFRISMPTHSATLEIGTFSFMEARLWSSMGIVDKIRTSPPEPMKVHYYFPQEFKTIHTELPSRPLSVAYTDSVAWNAESILRQLQPITASFLDSVLWNDSFILLSPTAIRASDSCRLTQSGVLVTERMGLFAAMQMIRSYYQATMRADRSEAFEKQTDIWLNTSQTAHMGQAVIMEKDLSYLLSIESTAHIPGSASAEYIGNHNLFIKRDANTAYAAVAQFSKPINLNIVRKMNRGRSSPAESFHAERMRIVSDMVSEQMGFFEGKHRIGYRFKSQMTRLGGFSLGIAFTDTIYSTARFDLEIIQPLSEHFIQPTGYHAFLQSEDLPTLTLHYVNPMSWVTDFSFLEPQPFTANGIQQLTRKTRASLLPSSSANVRKTERVNTLCDGEAKMLKRIFSETRERFLTHGYAKVGYPERFGGSVGFAVDVTTSEMSFARGALDLYAHGNGASDSTAVFCTEEPMPFETSLELPSAASADLGYVRYTYMRADCLNRLLVSANLESDGNWVYPAQVGSDLFIVQVYETDKFNEAGFFDFGRFGGHASFVSGVGKAETDWIYRDDADSGVGFAIAPSADMSFVNAAAWEYPVQNGSDLTITQVGYMKLNQHKLEVA